MESREKYPINTRLLPIPLLISIILSSSPTSLVASSNSDDSPVSTYVGIMPERWESWKKWEFGSLAPVEKYTDLQVSKKIEVGGLIDISFYVKNEKDFSIYVIGNVTCRQGENLADFREPPDEVSGGTILEGLEDGWGVSIDELLSPGTIVISFSYEVYYVENGVEKTFSSNGLAHEVIIEVEEKKPTYDWIY